MILEKFPKFFPGGVEPRLVGQERLLGDVWKRPGLNARDRSIVTLAALITRSQTIEMPFYFDLALNSGVKPGEISEMITHLAFYCGWANAMSAVVAAKDVFAARNIGTDQLPPKISKKNFLENVLPGRPFLSLR